MLSQSYRLVADKSFLSQSVPQLIFNTDSKKDRKKTVFRSFGLIFHFLPITKCEIG